MTVRGVEGDLPAGSPTAHLPAAAGSAALRPLRVRPGEASAPGGAGFSRTELGGRLPLVGSPEMDLLGEALHGFLACDRRSSPDHDRVDRARAILERWGVSENLDPAAAVTASDRL